MVDYRHGPKPGATGVDHRTPAEKADPGGMSMHAGVVINDGEFRLRLDPPCGADASVK